MAEQDFQNLDGVVRGRLVRLWPSEGTGGRGSGWDGDGLAAVLHHHLDSPVGWDAGAAGRTGGGPPGATLRLGTLLHHPAPPLDQLRRVKEWAKRAMRAPEGGGQGAAESVDEAAGDVVPLEVAAVLYFAGVLTARLRHGVRITGLDDRNLRDGGEWAARQPWVDRQTCGLLQEALQVLAAPEAGDGVPPLR